MRLISRHTWNKRRALMVAVFAVLGVTVSVLALLTVVIDGVLYFTRPRIAYSLQQADCTATAIAARNKAQGIDARSCVLVVRATNLKGKTQYVNYDDVGFNGNGTPLIRIYTPDDKFCYAPPDFKDSTFAPHATNTLELRCVDKNKPPKDYDASADTDPVRIVIDGYGGATIPIVQLDNLE